MQFKQFLWLLPFTSFIAGYLVLSFIFDRPDVETPNLVGKNIEQAVTLLSAQNLNPRILIQKEEPDLPTGTILSQTPAAQQKIKSNQSIFLVLSRKPDKITAPELLNKTTEQITQELEKLGIRNKAYAVTSSHPKGRCVGQLPAPHDTLENKKIITYISAGNDAPVLMPNFKGKNLTEITEFLKMHECVVEVDHNPILYEGHNCTTCTIIDQRPLAGSIVKLSDTTPLHVQLRV